MKLLTVAQLQTRVYAQKETNLSLLDGLFCQAKDAGADMICLPEMFSCPYETPNFPRLRRAQRRPLLADPFQAG